MHYWLGSFCRNVHNGKLYFPKGVIAISDIITIKKDLGNSIPSKSWMLYLLEVFNVQNIPIELNLICQFDNQNYFEAIFEGINRYRFREVLPEINHSYQRIIHTDKQNNCIKYILIDKVTNRSELFNLNLSNTSFDFNMSNQFTGLEWWNKIDSSPYPIRFETEISQLLFGFEDDKDAESIIFVSHEALIPNKDGSGMKYPILFQDVKLKDGYLCYYVGSGLCNQGIRYNC